MKFYLHLGLALLLSPFVKAQGEYQPVAKFIAEYCVKCHGPDKVESGVRLDNIRKIDAELWLNIYDQLKHADMPPPKATQPPDEIAEQITKLVDAITRDDRFTIATGYRRLNKREYRNTVRDLLGLSDDYFDPAAGVFEDEIEEGFDTNSESLIISNELLLEYLRSATISLNTALYTEATEMPKTGKTTFTAKQFTIGGQFAGINKGYAVQRQKKGGISPKQYNSVIPTSGKYRITATAMGIDRNPKLPAPGSPFKMSLMAEFAGTTKTFQVFNIKDDEFAPYSKVIWLEKGARPFYQGHVSPKPRTINRRRPAGKPWPIPALAIKDITIEGPLDTEWPPQTYKTTFQMDEMPDFTDRKTREVILRNFMSRAFRRQVDRTELARYTEYLEDQHKKQGSWLKAYIRTFAAIMASTDFLYIKEDLGKLEPFQLASRLSYFLWSSMPDMELLRLANSGDLLKKDVYLAQLRRMLKDPKAKHFVEGFASQWLSLDELGSMRPSEDDKSYKFYYKDQLEKFMRQETLLFFEHVLFENRPITDFLDSDYTFLNKPLADLYKIPFTGGKEMKLAKLPKNSVRGGLLGHASIHAITSNGVETLPVTRGHWVLDQLMGTPPPPPPEEVPAIVPDLSGKKTARDLLDAHRKDPKCYACHRIMDPPGLALENFDIIGRYRDTYGKGTPKIDAAGEYLGTKFSDVRGLRKALLKNKDTFTYYFIVKLAEYAKGRKLNRNDHEIVKSISNKAVNYDYQFMFILGEILTSDLMLKR
ncbi:hypothetical protein NT6N_30250 [Oceaniferula spumae]|uniref:DUF1592 domain-containing protein n=1 Tax=Oceaniferula spumae TaxID=2979115 RepID=A0AAT9FPX3_9BACT